MKRSTILCAALGLVAMAPVGALAQLFDPGELVAYWKFEDAGYTTAADSIGSNPATVNLQGASGGFVPGGIGGQAWQTTSDGVAFPGGSSDYLSTGTDAVKMVGATNFTVTGWFNIQDLSITGTQNNHFYDTDRAASEGYRVSMIAGHDAGGGPQTPSLSFLVENFETKITTNQFFSGWESNVWYFFVGKLDSGSNQVLWLARKDDTWANRVGTGLTNPNGPPGTNSAPLLLGRDSAAGAFAGLRDDFAIFNKALTSEEAEAIFDAGGIGHDLATLIAPATVTVSQVVVEDTTAVTFNTDQGGTYRLESSENLLTNNWIDAGFQITGDGTNRMAFDPTGFSTTQVYRVIKQ